MDLDLAQRLERTEGMVCSSFIEPHNLVANVGAAWHDFAGTIAIFDGVGSPLTQTFCLGTPAPVGEADLATIEAWFAERGADTSHEVSPFAAVEMLQVMVARGYKPIEQSSVLVQQIGEPMVPSALRVRAVDPDVDARIWADTAFAGWSEDPTYAPFMRAMVDVSIANRSMWHYLVERGGEPIATGSMGIYGDVALLAGASTIPSARGQGAQAALLAKRLVDARARGCTVAMMVANVGSTSQRNAERNGFRVAYTRTKWQRARS